MHYDSYDFAKDKGKPTITDKIGNTVEPSHEFAAVQNICRYATIEMSLKTYFTMPTD